jgi:hypothetical protein
MEQLLRKKIYICFHGWWKKTATKVYYFY